MVWICSRTLQAKEENLKRINRAFLLEGASGTVIGSLFLHPYGSVKAAKSAKPLLARADVDPIFFAVVKDPARTVTPRKPNGHGIVCRPTSWLVESDVGQSRSRMNLSHWDEYTIEKQQELLGRLGAAIRSRQMPPARYTLVHPSTKISLIEREHSVSMDSRLKVPLAISDADAGRRQSILYALKCTPARLDAGARSVQIAFLARLILVHSYSPRK
jgi:Haem-binding domain